MHILVGLLGALGIAIAIFWRLSQAASAAQDAHGAWRRWSWRRRADHDPIRDVDDARVAAAIMMVAIAEFDGALTDAEQRTMRQQICEKLGSSEKVADELIAHARWLNRNAGDIGGVFSKLRPVIEQQCAAEERLQLVAMLRAVDGVSSSSEVTGDQIARLERQLRVA